MMGGFLAAVGIMLTKLSALLCYSPESPPIGEDSACTKALHRVRVPS